jgi:hypothetical protein
MNNIGKFQRLMKLQDLGTTKISETTQNQYSTLILIAVGHQKIGRRIPEHLCKKDIQEPPTTDSRRAAKEAACQIRADVTVEALTP